MADISKSFGGSGFSGAMNLANYDKSFCSYQNTRDLCFNSFHDLDKKNLDNKGVVTAQSWNFGKLLRDSFKLVSSVSDENLYRDITNNYNFIELINTFFSFNLILVLR